MNLWVLLFSEGQEWGVGSVVVDFAFLGRPDFPSRGPQTLLKTSNLGPLD